MRCVEIGVPVFLVTRRTAEKSRGVTCDPLFIRTCHVRHSHCDIIRKKQAVTELFQLTLQKKQIKITFLLQTRRSHHSAKFANL